MVNLLNLKNLTLSLQLVIYFDFSCARKYLSEGPLRQYRLHLFLFQKSCPFYPMFRTFHVFQTAYALKIFYLGAPDRNPFDTRLVLGQTFRNHTQYWSIFGKSNFGTTSFLVFGFVLRGGIALNFVLNSLWAKLFGTMHSRRINKKICFISFLYCQINS